jgi:hypothetical protein
MSGPGRGVPGRFPPAEIAEVKALACELPAQTGRALSRWSAAELARAGQRDLLALGKRQAAALEIPAATWPHAAAVRHPGRALLAIRARRRGRVGDERAALQRIPEAPPRAPAR